MCGVELGRGHFRTRELLLRGKKVRSFGSGGVGEKGEGTG